MWSPWGGSSRPRPILTAISLPSSSSECRSRFHSSRFSYSSFKDIDTLLENELDSSKSPSLSRKFHISPSLIHSFNNTNPRTVPTPSYSIIHPPHSDHNTIVFYFTTLRIIRRTYEDCRVVRSILQGLGITIDERDVSIDDRFRDELRSILGHWNITLPCVFIGGKYIGGADDVKRLYNSGELQVLIEKLPRSKANGCDICGGLRFVVCDICDGSHKVFMEKSGSTIKCGTCNANGLIRCPMCFFMLPRHTK
ncbi:hypothetical protein Lal_00003523 [Lupinus albus]|uniref:Putative thioredoxin-like protein n=1 Tax=Lupinus albus TaxID=3870 RepID=A0A6A4Q396_LUPAL|nr:putative thioredoxin-like protein [Lupinus albus]KAF1870317.1 hypothetical protein Lal_00003523 [Lupinus albus]